MLYGRSGGGKTTLIEVLYHMMMGINAKSVVISANRFTQSECAKMKYAFHGAPLLVDDISDDRIAKHLIPSVKDDNFGNDVIGLDNYPAVVLTANASVNGLKSELTKRMVAVYVNVGSPSNASSDIEARVCANSGTALYRLYMGRMLDKVLAIVKDLENPEDNDYVFPDVLRVSSEVLQEIFAEYVSGPLPEYIRVLTWNDYFGKVSRAASSLNYIQEAWVRRNSSFAVDVANDQVLFRTGNVERAQALKDELDVYLEITQYDDNVLISHLSTAGDVLGIDLVGPAVRQTLLAEWMRDDGKNFKFDWRKNLCFINPQNESTAILLEKGLPQVGLTVSRAGSLVTVCNIAALTEFAGITPKKTLWDVLVSAV